MNRRQNKNLPRTLPALHPKLARLARSIDSEALRPRIEKVPWPGSFPETHSAFVERTFGGITSLNGPRRLSC